MKLLRLLRHVDPVNNKTVYRGLRVRLIIKGFCFTTAMENQPPESSFLQALCNYVFLAIHSAWTVTRFFTSLLFFTAEYLFLRAMFRLLMTARDLGYIFINAGAENLGLAEEVEITTLSDLRAHLANRMEMIINTVMDLRLFDTVRLRLFRAGVVYLSEVLQDVADLDSPADHREWNEEPDLDNVQRFITLAEQDITAAGNITERLSQQEAPRSIAQNLVSLNSDLQYFAQQGIATRLRESTLFNPSRGNQRADSNVGDLSSHFQSLRIDTGPALSPMRRPNREEYEYIEMLARNRRHEPRLHPIRRRLRRLDLGETSEDSRHQAAERSFRHHVRAPEEQHSEATVRPRNRRHAPRQRATREPSRGLDFGETSEDSPHQVAEQSLRDHNVHVVPEGQRSQAEVPPWETDSSTVCPSYSARSSNFQSLISDTSPVRSPMRRPPTQAQLEYIRGREASSRRYEERQIADREASHITAAGNTIESPSQEAPRSTVQNLGSLNADPYFSQEGLAAGMREVPLPSTSQECHCAGYRPVLSLMRPPTQGDLEYIARREANNRRYAQRQGAIPKSSHGLDFETSEDSPRQVAEQSLRDHDFHVPEGQHSQDPRRSTSDKSSRKSSSRKSSRKSSSRKSSPKQAAVPPSVADGSPKSPSNRARSVTIIQEEDATSSVGGACSQSSAGVQEHDHNAIKKLNREPEERDPSED